MASNAKKCVLVATSAAAALFSEVVVAPPANALEGPFVSIPQQVATYAATTTSLTTVSGATDFFTVTGSANMVVRIREVLCNNIGTAGAPVEVYGILRSTADTGGTSTTQTAVPMDSADIAASAVAKAYTANPSTLGTSIGTVIFGPQANGSASLSATPLDWVFDASTTAKAPTLRGTAQQFALNANAAASQTLACTVWWTESGS